jgi:hypothetical protein
LRYGALKIIGGEWIGVAVYPIPRILIVMIPSCN